MKAKSAGFVSSLGAVMYDLGEAELTKEIHQEKLSSDPIYQVQKKKQAEELGTTNACRDVTQG